MWQIDTFTQFNPMAFIGLLLSFIILLLLLILFVLIAPGRLQSIDLSGAAMNLRNIKKSKTDRSISGVCGGLGEHTPIPSWIWRVIFLVSFLFGGFGLIAYVILAICMPSASSGVA